MEWGHRAARLTGLPTTSPQCLFSRLSCCFPSPLFTEGQNSDKKGPQSHQRGQCCLDSTSPQLEQEESQIWQPESPD